MPASVDSKALTKNAKSFRCNTYEKTWGGAPVMVNQTPDEVSLSELWECGGLPPLFFRPCVTAITQTSALTEKREQAPALHMLGESFHAGTSRLSGTVTLAGK